MLVQSLSLGLGEQWEKVKAAYAQANRALGDIVKVSLHQAADRVSSALLSNALLLYVTGCS